MKPRLLDLFSGAGGAAVGYARAGFKVVGVDHVAQPNYPFPIVVADALEWLEKWVLSGHETFDAIHASPPCQAFTTMSGRWRNQETKADGHQDLIAATRELLEEAGLPYVIENVEGASHSLTGNVVKICGATVGLKQSRHRLFECGGWFALVPPCSCRGREFKSVIGKYPDGRWLWRRPDGRVTNYVVSSLEEGQELLGIDWMNWRELAEAVPPAYTELLGEQLMHQVRETV